MPGAVRRAGCLVAAVLDSPCSPRRDAGPAPSAPLVGCQRRRPTPPRGAAPEHRGAVHGPTPGPRAARACGTEGYRGALGRIEATDARTVRFTLCAPTAPSSPGSRIPRSAILDAAAHRPPRRRPGRARASLAGTGPFRIDAWIAGRERAARARSHPTHRPVPADGARRIVLRWAADPTQRDHRAAVGDRRRHRRPGLRRPRSRSRRCPSSRSRRATASRPRTSGSGPGRGLGKAAVRRALAGSLDRDALAARRDCAAGSTTATHVTPCDDRGRLRRAPTGTGSTPRPRPRRWTPPGSTARRRPAPRPGRGRCPGLPDPAGLAAAVPRPARRRTSGVSVRDRHDARSRTTAAALATGELDGLYLGGVASSIADPAGVPRARCSARASSRTRRDAHAQGARAALADAGATADPARARTAFAARQRRHPRRRAASSRWSTRGPWPPSAPTSTGVVDLARSALDPLGSFTPGGPAASSWSCRRREPDGAYCARPGVARRATGCAAS